MTRFLITLFYLCTITVWGQTNTEVYLLDVKTVNGKTEIVNPRNISNNEGYDNQPSFFDENTILFSGTRNKQTDIAKYDIETSELVWVTDTPGGSEYSPLKIPGKNAASAVRLDTTGLQRLYEYSVWDGTYVELLEDLKVAYHVWYDKNTIVSAVPSEQRLDLVVSNLVDGTHQTVFKNVGRSLHKIPDSNLISFIDKTNEEWSIRSLNPSSGAVETITRLFKNIDDICWLNKGAIIAADNKVLMEIHPKNQKEWHRFLRLEKKGINNISRIAVSPNGKYLSLVVEQSPSGVVQNQLDAYNAHNIDAFLNAYSEDVEVFDYPATLKFSGKDQMREFYTQLFESTLDLNYEIKNRIALGNKVIDKVRTTANGSSVHTVVIYEVENGKISKVSIMR